MGKKANEKRRAVFKELEENGKLDKPAIKVRNMDPKPIVGLKTKAKPLPRTPHGQCCLIKYEGKLPTHFRKCHGCPLEDADEVL